MSGGRAVSISSSPPHRRAAAVLALFALAGSSLAALAANPGAPAGTGDGGFSGSPTSAERTLDATFARFAGAWELDLEADSATFGERGGEGQGTMHCVAGPGNHWMDCTLESVYTGLGAYVLKIVLHRAGPAGEYGAFVTNSFGGGRLYRGAWAAADRLVFEDAWIDPTRTWPHQRTTYTFGEDATMRFDIEVSADGEAWQPHSAGVYRRAGRPPPPAQPDRAGS